MAPASSHSPPLVLALSADGTHCWAAMSAIPQLRQSQVHHAVISRSRPGRAAVQVLCGRKGDGKQRRKPKDSDAEVRRGQN